MKRGMILVLALVALGSSADLLDVRADVVRQQRPAGERARARTVRRLYDRAGRTYPEGIG